jgi:hypothetical protein
MLVVGYVFAIRSERALCREVRVNLAYRWFCGLGIEDKVPNHSVFSRARNERFRAGQACGPPAASCIRSVLCVSVTFASSHQPGRRTRRQVQVALCLKARPNARHHQMRLLQQNRPEAVIAQQRSPASTVSPAPLLLPTFAYQCLLQAFHHQDSSHNKSPSDYY